MDTDTPTPAPTGRPPTSTDVARLANVSQATVSYVLNDAPGKRIKEETRARVLAAARELGYVPSTSARALRTGRSNLVLIPVPNIPAGPLAARFFGELTGRLRALGYEAVMYGGDDSAPGAEAARHWAGWRPAAVLADGQLLDRDAVAQLEAAGTRAIIGIGSVRSPYAPSILFDDTTAGRLAVEHLIARGRRRLGVVLPAEPELAPYARRRSRGASQAAGDLPLQTFEVPFSEEAAAALVTQWLDSAERPNGIYCYNDEYAMLLMRTLQDAGLEIPRDIAVVGTDDLPLCTLLRPRLTSVRVLAGISGTEVAELIHSMVVRGGWKPDHQIAGSVELIHRESS